MEIAPHYPRSWNTDGFQLAQVYVPEAVLGPWIDGFMATLLDFHLLWYAVLQQWLKKMLSSTSQKTLDKSGQDES